ncbi:hypothetical protein U1Q18_033575 [Sarracenia purpurea var. burkii]
MRASFFVKASSQMSWYIVLVGDTEGQHGRRLMKAEGVDGERAADGGIRDFEEVDEAGDTVLVVDAGDDVELGVWTSVLDSPLLVNHVRPRWIVQDSDQWCGYCGQHCYQYNQHRKR